MWGKIKKLSIPNPVVYFFLAVGVVYNIYSSALFILNRDVKFFTDVARDFLLFMEIDQKKLILIGPRSSTAGIFHGPLWLYLNYPAYLMGHGDPFVVACFWFVVNLIFLATSFLVAKKIFGKLAAIVYVLLLSGNMIFQTSAMFNPHGALFLIPVFFLMIVLYHQSQKWWQLALHILIGGLIIQFQMAVGIPLMILTGVYVLYRAIQTKRFWHLGLFIILIPTLSNFLIFEIRHEFIMTKSILGYASPKTSTGQVFDYAYMFFDRIDRLIDAKFAMGMTPAVTGVIFALVLVLTGIKIKSNSKQSFIYGLILFYYFGYVALTFVNKGAVLDHQFFPILALTNLWFASLCDTKPKQIFWLALATVFLFNWNYSRDYKEKSQEFFGKDTISWKFLSGVANDIILRQKGQSFGYFVYSPDQYAYQPRYAMIQNFKGMNAKEYAKETTTYVISAPDDPTNRFAIQKLWLKNDANINENSVWEKDYANGYKVEEFKLTDIQIKEPFNPKIDVGIHFR